MKRRENEQQRKQPSGLAENIHARYIMLPAICLILLAIASAAHAQTVVTEDLTLTEDHEGPLWVLASDGQCTSRSRSPS